MSSDAPVLQVEGLSKSFHIYERPRDRLKQIFMPRLQSLAGREAPTQYFQEFKALDNINFEVGRGQTVGIVGQNGSGKSTLLQIICGTMAPTSGIVHTRGKVAALLELGSGFNPEFTGIENIYLNGSLLGLSRAKIDDKMDYIIAFAEIGGHINHPVKTYSSGMMLRLAFAVQVAVETELLIIDEALAVGDARFQMKCFRRLEELKEQGTTILFVSHATELVRSFCDLGLVLDRGKPIFWGDAKTATIKYLASVFPDQTKQTSANSKKVDENDVGTDDSHKGQVDMDATDGSLTVHPDETAMDVFGVGGATLDWIKIYGLKSPNLIFGGHEVKIQCRFSWDSDFIRRFVDKEGYLGNITLGTTIADKKGKYLFGCNGFDKNLPVDCLKNKGGTVEIKFVMPYLVGGEYFLGVAIALGNLEHHVQLKWYDNLLQFECLEGDVNVFGLLGIDYTMDIIEQIRS